MEYVLLKIGQQNNLDENNDPESEQVLLRKSCRRDSTLMHEKKKSLNRTLCCIRDEAAACNSHLQRVKTTPLPHHHKISTWASLLNHKLLPFPERGQNMAAYSVNSVKSHPRLQV